MPLDYIVMTNFVTYRFSQKNIPQTKRLIAKQTNKIIDSWKETASKRYELHPFQTDLFSLIVFIFSDKLWNCQIQLLLILIFTWIFSDGFICIWKKGLKSYGRASRPFDNQSSEYWKSNNADVGKVQPLPENIARGTTDPGYWVHDLNKLFQLKLFQINFSLDATCISFIVGHQMAPLILPHCLRLPYWHHQLVLSCYHHQPESHQLSLQIVCQSLSDIRTHRSDPRDTWVR